MRILPVAAALRRPYIQPNAPELHFRLVFDVDRAGGALAWDDAVLAPPSWTAIDTTNMQPHIGYEIAVPIGKGPNHRQKPMRLLAAIESAYCDALQADPSYAGVLCKNPLHEQWQTTVWNPNPYDLPTLADYVDLTRFNDRRRTTEWEAYGLGRNCLIFEKLRRWAYAHVDEFRLSGAEASSAWLSACYERALKYNHAFVGYSAGKNSGPLNAREVSFIAKSVSKWTWRFYWGKAESDRRFSELQAARGRKSGQARRNGSVEELKPWSALGISRATYYRRKSQRVRLEP